MIRYLISIFVVLLLVAPVESAQITVSRMGFGDTLVRVYGPIEHGDDTIFDRLTKPITDSSHTLILLDSPGGYVLPPCISARWSTSGVFLPSSNVQPGGDADRPVH
jgi:hypothetical protein